MTQHDRQILAALSTLILLQLVMLLALFAGVRPHPPEATPLFGIAPFLGAALAVALCAILLQPLSTRSARGLSVLAALMALVSFGPQKYFNAEFGLIWPAVCLGQVAAVVIFVRVAVAARQKGRSDRVAVPVPGQA